MGETLGQVEVPELPLALDGEAHMTKSTGKRRPQGMWGDAAVIELLLRPGMVYPCQRPNCGGTVLPSTGVCLLCGRPPV